MTPVEIAPVGDTRTIADIFFVILELRVYGVDRITIEIDHVRTHHIQFQIVRVQAEIVASIRIVEDSRQRRAAEVKLHYHAQPVAAGTWETDYERVFWVGLEFLKRTLIRDGL